MQDSAFFVMNRVFPSRCEMRMFFNSNFDKIVKKELKTELQFEKIRNS